jgi:hypothetical protein
MKTLRQVCAATILSLMLAVSVLAGHIDTPGAPAPATAPAPTPASTTTSTSTATSFLLTVLSLIYR